LPDKDEAAWKKVEHDTWKVFDDSSIRHFSFNADLQKEAFGGDHQSSSKNSDAMTDAEVATFLSSGGSTYGKSAYMLIYERKSKNNLKEVELNE
jgi:hypothetical protein